MPVIKCKMCGGDIRLDEGKTFGTCEYCGSVMTLPRVSDEQRAAAFNRGNHFRRMGEFDKALAVYERIVAEDDTDAEAHWCCALCRFGIEYVEDPATYEWLPTCHRASFDSFLEDVDYLAALEHSDGITRRQYQKDAAKIAEVQKGILATSQSTEPYDVFISYKELDADGNRTRDSILAQEIYYRLKEKGWRVFFSRISLEDVPGTQYEPYIFAALNSAKVMIVVGTSAENLNAVWVKNEWSRYLSLMRKDRSKLLIPCYRDMDPYDLPEQLSVLMSYDMGRIGFIQDLIRGVDKVLSAEKPKEAAAPVKERVIVQQSGGGPNVQALLKRGHQALEDGDWAKAKGFYDQVLSMDAENADAFLGLALAGQQVRDLRSYFDTLSPGRVNVETDTLECDKAHIARSIAKSVVPGYCEGSELKKLYDFAVDYPVKLREETAATQQIKSRFNGDRNLSRAFRYAQGETKQKLETLKNELFDTLDKRVRAAETSDKKALEEAKSEFAAKLEAADRRAEEMSRAAQEKRETDYQEACRQAEIAKDDYEFTNAGIALKRVGRYKDADERARECEQKATEIKTRREQAERVARKKAKEEQQKRFLMIGIIIGTIAVTAVVVLLIITRIIIPIRSYSAALRLYEQGRYEDAIAAFAELGDYKDSKKQIVEIKNAIIESANQTAYEEASRLLADGKYLDAEAAFKKLGDFSDSRDQAGQAKEKYLAEAYQDALSLFSDKDYLSAITAFRSLGDYQDSKELLNKAKYSQAEELLASCKYDEAISMFNSLGDYSDSKSRAYEATSLKSDAAYSDAETMATKGKNYEAAIAFYAIKDYKDSWERCFQLWGTITNRKTIAAGQYTLVGLKNDGTVVSAGDKTSFHPDGYLKDVAKWNDIVAVAAGGNYAYGLKADGTVVYAAGPYFEPDAGSIAEVSKWKDIVAIDAGYSHIVGIKADGTVLAAGDNQDYQCNVSEWADIIRISAGNKQTIGLKADGTIAYAGWLNSPDWKNVKDVYASKGTDRFILGVKKDGTVLFAGDTGYQDERKGVLDWHEIVSVSDCGRVFGLKNDGSVVCTSDELLKTNLNLSSWHNIVAITSGDNFFGLTSNGMIVSLVSKSNTNNVNIKDSNIQEVNCWRNIMLP